MNGMHELSSLPKSALLKESIPSERAIHDDFNRDELALARSGKKQVLEVSEPNSLSALNNF